MYVRVLFVGSLGQRKGPHGEGTEIHSERSEFPGCQGSMACKT